MFETNTFFYIVGLFITIFTAVWSLAWWLSGQFTDIRNLIYSQVEKINSTLSQKLDYHEKHDDTRFASMDLRLASIRDDIWDIRVRNAAVKGVIVNSKGPSTSVVNDLKKHFTVEEEVE